MFWSWNYGIMLFWGGGGGGGWNNRMTFFFTLPVSFTGSYTGDEPNFPWKNNYILQKMVFGLENVVNFKEFL